MVLMMLRLTNFLMRSTSATIFCLASKFLRLISWSRRREGEGTYEVETSSNLLDVLYCDVATVAFNVYWQPSSIPKLAARLVMWVSSCLIRPYKLDISE